MTSKHLLNILGIDYEDFYEMLVLENVYEYDYDDLS